MPGEQALGLLGVVGWCWVQLSGHLVLHVAQAGHLEGLGHPALDDVEWVCPHGHLVLLVAQAGHLEGLGLPEVDDVDLVSPHGHLVLLVAQAGQI